MIHDCCVFIKKYFAFKFMLYKLTNEFDHLIDLNVNVVGYTGS